MLATGMAATPRDIGRLHAGSCMHVDHTVRAQFTVGASVLATGMTATPRDIGRLHAGSYMGVRTYSATARVLLC